MRIVQILPVEEKVYQGKGKSFGGAERTMAKTQAKGQPNTRRRAICGTEETAFCRGRNSIRTGKREPGLPKVFVEGKRQSFNRMGLVCPWVQYEADISDKSGCNCVNSSKFRTSEIFDPKAPLGQIKKDCQKSTFRTAPTGQCLAALAL